MKRYGLFVVGTSLLIGGALVLHRRSSARGGDVVAETVTAKRGLIEETVEATGEVQPLNRVEIKPPIAGRVEKLLSDEGERVQSGQVLGWMSSTDRAAILDAARAQGPEALAHWQDAYKPTPILAPLSGVLILRNVVVGQTVDASTVLFAMSDKLIVKANVDEVDIGRVRPGMEARITLDSYPDQPITGTVFQILHEGVNVSNVITYGVKIDPRRVPSFFRSQMTASISLIARQKDQAILLPESAVQTASGGPRQVLVPGPDGKPVPRPVRIGLESGGQVEILDGIQDGDKVLVMQKRYTPQQAASSSPLIMGGARQGQRSQDPNTRRPR